MIDSNVLEFIGIFIDDSNISFTLNLKQFNYYLRLSTTFKIGEVYYILNFSYMMATIE